MLRLRLHAKVLATSKVHDKVSTGAIGKVVGFADPNAADLDDGSNPLEVGYGVEPEQAQHDMHRVNKDHAWPMVEFDVGADKIQVLFQPLQCNMCSAALLLL